MGKRTVELEGPRWLVLLLDGLAAADVSGEHTPHLRALCDSQPGHAPLCEPVPPSGAVDVALFHALPLTELGVRGLQTDRRSWSLRPDWSSDRAAIDGLARRPRGRADVSFVWLRDAGRAAADCGLGSAGHRQALRDLDAMVLRVVQMQARRELPPHVVAFAYGGAAPVRRSFDVLGTLRAALPRRSASALRCVADRDHLLVQARSMHDLAVCREMLAHAPFVGHGREVAAAELARHGVSCRSDQLLFVPHEGTAFAAHDVRAARRWDRGPADVWLPWPQPADTACTVESIAARLTAEWRTHLAPVRPPVDADARSIYADHPDLSSVFDPELRALLHVL